MAFPPAPSFSFAWDPFKKGKTSIRGGYGISYVIDNNIPTIDNAANTGFSQAIALNDTSGTLSSGVPVVPIPSLHLPQMALENFRLDDGFALFTFDPNVTGLGSCLDRLPPSQLPIVRLVFTTCF